MKWPISIGDIWNILLHVCIGLIEFHERSAYMLVASNLQMTPYCGLFRGALTPPPAPPKEAQMPNTHTIN